MSLCTINEEIFNRVYAKKDLNYKPFIVSNGNLYMLGYSVFSEIVRIPESFVVGGICYKTIGIEPDAFKGYNDLKVLYIPNSVVYMDYSMFSNYDFPSLSNVYIDNYRNALPVGNIEFEVSEMNSHIEFIWARGENKEDFNVNDDGVLLGFSEVGRKNYKEVHENHSKLFGESYCSYTINSKNIGREIKAVADFAFLGELYNVNSLVVEDVLVIGNNAFAKNYNLRYLEIGDSVVYIGENCFEENNMLENVVIPKTVEYIFNTILYNCVSILSVRVDEGTKVLGRFANRIREVERNLIIYDNYTDTNTFVISI